MNGKLLYDETQRKDASYKNIKKYEVYLTDDKDITYMRNFYNFAHHSLSLWKSKIPAGEKLFENQTNIRVLDAPYLRIRNALLSKIRSSTANSEGFKPEIERDLIVS